MNEDDYTIVDWLDQTASGNLHPPCTPPRYIYIYNNIISKGGCGGKTNSRGRPKGRQRGFPFPEGWQADEQFLDELVGKFGHSREKTAWLVATCVDHHTAKGNCYVDHKAAIRTWFRNDRDWAAQRGSGSGGRGRGQSVAEDRDAIASQLVAELAAKRARTVPTAGSSDFAHGVLEGDVKRRAGLRSDPASPGDGLGSFPPGCSADSDF